MKVRGLTILTRKAIITRQFGADAWLTLYRDVAGAHRSFRALITADVLVPLPDYLALHDEMLRRFYMQGDSANLDLGRQSARWALVDGPCKPLMDSKNLRGLVRNLPKLWGTYFADTESRSQARLNGDSVEFEVLDLPQWHPYLEHFVVGYMTEVLERFCVSPIGSTRIRGGGGQTYRYLLHTSAAVLDHPPERRVGMARSPAAVEGRPPLSSRETDVLMLASEGKTNSEIGDILGISGKTVQHHLARVYRKIDVTGRVEAAMWLARRGLLSN